MRELEIEIESRPNTGTVAADTYRRQNYTPVVAYGDGKPAISGMVKTIDFNRLAKKGNTTTLFKVKSSESSLNGRLALVKEMQIDYMNGRALHADFMLIREDRKLKIRVPLHLTGEPAGVKGQGGVLTSSLHDIGVLCLPRAIPEFIEVDVSGLALGQSLHASDVKFPAGVELADNPEESIASVVAPRTVEEEVKAAATEGEAAAATTEGGEAGAEAKEGAPAAEGAAKDDKGAADKGDKAAKSDKKEKK